MTKFRVTFEFNHIDNEWSPNPKDWYWADVLGVDDEHDVVNWDTFEITEVAE